MTSRLQKVFSHAQPESYLGQIRFANSEFSKDFREKLEKMYVTGTSQKIDGVDSIELNQLINGEEYPLNNSNKIINCYIEPSIEPVEIDVETQYGKFAWNFYRTRLAEKIILSNSEKSIIVLKLEFLKTNILNLTVNSSPQHANSISEIIYVHSALLALFDRLFNGKPLQLSDMISSVKNELEFWQRVHKIEESLSINFDPNVIDPRMLNEAMQEVDELYLLLVEKAFLRENRGFSSFTAGSFSRKMDAPIVNINDKFALNFNTNYEINIWGVKICVYSVCVAFNHIIDSIKENDESGEVIVSLREDESNPRYISLRGFMSEKDQEEEHNRLNENFSENIKAYENAETFEKLYKEKILWE